MMTYKKYDVKGINPKTGRKKTISIEVPNNKEPREVIEKQIDIVEPFEINETPFPAPTDRQINYANSLGVVIPNDACQYDVSALISRAVDSDSEPNQGLIEFAENQGLLFSKYIGKKSLYDLIFNNLPLIDKIAFFCFSIYRYLSDDRHSNLDTSPHREIFYSFANQFEQDKKFVSSLAKYEGSDLRYFGTLKIRENNFTNTLNGGSVNTSAYKITSEFLNSKFDTPLTKTKIIDDDGTFHKKKQNKSSVNFVNPANNLGVKKSKGIAYVLLIFFGYLGMHKFYLRKIGMGFLYLFTFGLFGIGLLVDLFTLGKQVDIFNSNCNS